MVVRNRRFNRLSWVCMVVAAAFAVLQAAPAFAQNSGQITGNITRASTGAPERDVVLGFYAGSTLAGSALTDESGNYTSSPLPPGSYWIWVIPPESTGLAGQLYNSISCANYCSVDSGTPVVVTSNNVTPGINLALQLAGSITGVVTGAATGQAIAGAVVYFRTTTGSYTALAATDAQGAYTSPLLPSGSYFVSASAAGFVGQLHNGVACISGSCSITAGTPVAVNAPNVSNLNFALASGATITGTVTNSTTGAPVSGVRLDFYSGGSLVGSATTNSQGAYTSPGLVTGSYYLRAIPPAASGLIAELHNNIICNGDCPPFGGTLVPVTVPNATTINFALDPGATITGTVSNAATLAPVIGATINFYTSTQVFRGSASTNAQGVYTSPVLPTGSYLVSAIPSTTSGLVGQLHNNVACPAGNCPLTSGTPVALNAPNPTTINFALAPGAAITGTVTNATTLAPVASVVVQVYSSSGLSLTAVSTNAQGAYTSPPLPTGSYFVRAIPPLASGLAGQLYSNIFCQGSYCPVTSGTPVVATAPSVTPNINFALEPGASITGSVTSLATAAPLANVTVAVYSSNGSFVISALTNAQGAYSIVGLATGTYFARAFPPSSYNMIPQLYNNIPCPGDACVKTSGNPVAVTAPNATSTINFALVSLATITGTVTSIATAGPVASVTVSAYSSNGSFVTSTSTNAQGAYTLTGLATGAYFVRALPTSASGLIGQLYNNIACPGGNCSVTSGTPVGVTAPNSTSNINFLLVSLGAITGTVTNATTGMPVAGVGVDVFSNTGTYLRSASTDAQGVYTANGLSSGSYFALAYPPSGSVLLRQLYSNIDCSGSSFCAVTSGTPVAVTAPNTTPNVNFALVSGASITGTVTNAATGAPVASVSVAVYSNSGSFFTSSSTNAQGAYTLIGLATGSYFVRATPLSASGLVGQLYNNIACPAGNCSVTGGAPVVVTAPNATNINFALVPGGTITGVVTTPSDAPVSGSTVLFYSSAGSFVTSASTNAQGVYTSPGLPTGSYFVLAAPPSGSALISMLYFNVSCPGGSCNVTSGTPVAVNAPNVVPNINIRLSLALDAENDAFANALVIGSVPYKRISSTVGATTTSEDPAVTCGSRSTQRSVWYLFTPTVDGPVVVNTVGSAYDTILSIYTGSPGSFSPVGCNDDFNGLQSSLAIQGTAGQRLAILVTSYSGSGGVLVLNVARSPGAFGKSGPATTSLDQPLSPTLSWGASADATSYEYCYDTSNNNICNANWIWVGTAISARLSGLAASTTYYWQVRALNAGGTTYADGSAAAFWTFTTGTAVPPFGQVDTPLQNAAGVQGGIGVTGWALDDTGVTRVQIFRNCLPFEAVNCQSLLDRSMVYIGDAVFLAGARPDVAAAFPTHPNSTRAGWGYLMLTPMLPNVITGQPYGGEGPLTIYAVATDTNGNQTLLGRSADPVSPDYAAPTAITMTNSTIAKPFGAIDTPGQGETISGVFNNFGWALTPDINTTAGDPGDILIPANGSTMTVFIDGLPTALVSFNQCRGDVGNPVPLGLYCNDDVASIFGNPIPQAVLTTRTSNPTLFRNLDTGNAAIGAYTFDTTTLSNGPHTIAWSVTDSAGRTEGIGSRFFIVSNASADAGLDTNRQATSSAPTNAVASELSNAATVNPGVFVRSGFDLAEAWKPLHADDDRKYSVRLTELGRLELWLGAPVEAGYMVVDGTLQPLPVGTSLGGSVFAWMPPAGYVGPYELVFVRGGERIHVIVTVK